MGNPYFQFQQFRVEQGQSAMKVCTDACIFGAFVASILESSGKTNFSVLDVGAGTGLLSLMMAQKNAGAKFIALEPDEGSFSDCKQNFGLSRWSDRLTVYHQTLQSFSGSAQSTVDVVVCNPPFFLNHLKSPDPKRNAVLHMDKFAWKDWLDCIFKISHAQTELFFLFDPATWQKSVGIILESGFFVLQKLDLMQTKGRFWRTMVWITQNPPDETKAVHLDVYSPDGGLSKEVNNWLLDYYLLKPSPEFSLNQNRNSL